MEETYNNASDMDISETNQSQQRFRKRRITIDQSPIPIKRLKMSIRAYILMYMTWMLFGNTSGKATNSK
ncbi:uncharacterized protein Dmoj_GI15046 [Drosophila mojavensis]|uniref:Uncharacterized protein n=1 Tax=Drosophila mojavensis TaxID=7230 RepID=B4L3H1_DROMO|nr:uncharacterized protein Dmoj_GI15046 [Drosophila mojavensis]